MGRIVVSEFLTLDGVMQAPGGREEDTEGGFEHGGWQGPYWDDAAQGSAVDAAMRETGGLLLGRKTYEIFADYWPNADEDLDFAEVMNSLPKYVVSTTLEEPLSWQNSTLIEEPVADSIAALKGRVDKDLLVFGSGGLVQTLMRHGLVDRYLLMIHSVVLGSGKRLFREGIPRTGLRLVASEVSATGTLILTYEPGEPG